LRKKSKDTGIRIQETGNRKQKTGNRIQEAGYKKQEARLGSKTLMRTWNSY